MIGGSGEKKTFGLAARHFDHLNIIIAGFPELPGKLAALAQRCEEVDRDPATLETSVLVSVVAGEGVTEDVIPPAMAGRMVAGTAEQVAERLKTQVFDAGVDGVIINMPGASRARSPGRRGAAPALTEVAGGTSRRPITHRAGNPGRPTTVNNVLCTSSRSRQ